MDAQDIPWLNSLEKLYYLTNTSKNIFTKD